MRSVRFEVYDQPAANFNRRLGALVPRKQTSKHLLLIFLIFATFKSFQFSKESSSVLFSSLSIFDTISYKKDLFLIPYGTVYPDTQGKLGLAVCHF